MNYPISIIIPVYKNYEVFYKYLRENKKYFVGCEVIISNDDPTTNVTKEIKEIYPEAIVLNNVKNLGFSSNVNQAMMKASRDFIFLMNSDVILKNDSFIKAMEHFKDDSQLFAVGFAQIEMSGKIVGSNRAYFEKGLIGHSRRPSNQLTNSQVTLNFWAEGGSSIFDKKIFVDLGMFDELYNPFYWEDVDLSYRAWKAGYKIIFDQNVQVEHHHESTIGKYFDKKNIEKIAFRNQLIFQWKNLTDTDLLIKHLANIPRFIFLPGFFEALFRLPKILTSRNKTVKLFIKSDKEILSKFIK